MIHVTKTHGFLHFVGVMVMGPILLGLKTFILPWVFGVQRMVVVRVDDGWMSPRSNKLPSGLFGTIVKRLLCQDIRANATKS